MYETLVQYYCVYIHELGSLFDAWDAHHQVNVLRLTLDSAALVSGSDDSPVLIWSVKRYDSGERNNAFSRLIRRLVDHDFQGELAAPHCTLSDPPRPSYTSCGHLASFRRIGS